MMISIASKRSLRGNMKVDIRAYKVTAKGRDYWYAWRPEKGSKDKPPRLVGEPGSAEFMRSYNEAIENRRTGYW